MVEQTQTVLESRKEFVITSLQQKPEVRIVSNAVGDFLSLGGIIPVELEQKRTNLLIAEYQKAVNSPFKSYKAIYRTKLSEFLADSVVHDSKRVSKFTIEIEKAAKSQQASSLKKVTAELPLITYCLNHSILFDIGSASLNTPLKLLVDQFNDYIIEAWGALRKVKKHSEFATLENKTETELVLMHRFVQARKSLLENYDFYETDEVCEMLGKSELNKSSKSRLLNHMIDNNQLIGFKLANQYLIPAFQFNQKTAVHEALLDQLETINKNHVNHLDLCIWLTSMTSVTLKQKPLHTSFKGMSYKDAMALNQDNSQSKDFEGLPLTAVLDGDKETFAMLVDEFLHTDTYDIYQGRSVGE